MTALSCAALLLLGLPAASYGQETDAPPEQDSAPQTSPTPDKTETGTDDEAGPAGDEESAASDTSAKPKLPEFAAKSAGDPEWTMPGKNTALTRFSAQICSE